MRRIRVSARAVVTVYSPPFSSFEGSSGDGDVNVYRHKATDAAGDATRFSDWDDGGSTIEGVHDPVLSPDGTMIAFIGVPVATNLGALYVVDNVPGSTATQLEDDASSWISHPMWSPDSTKIVFNRGNAAGNIYGGTIETIPAAGGSPTVLYTPAANFRAYRPAYSFDGNYIAFVLGHEVGSSDGLYVMEDDGSNPTEIDSTIEYALDGSQHGWANAELTLAYDDGTTAGRDVFVIAHDGTGKTKISVGATDGAANRCGKFCWLPDDAAVIFASNQIGTRYSLYRGETDGSGVTSLNASHGPANQAWMKQPLVYNSRIWFIEVASGTSGGMIGSTALDGTDYIEELDVNDATLLDDFSGGTGFEYQ